jgi:hypothetical protein
MTGRSHAIESGRFAEALADEDGRGQRGERVGDVGRSAAAERRGAADREDELVLGIGIELILGAEHEIVEALARGVFACSTMRKVSANVTAQSGVMNLL